MNILFITIAWPATGERNLYTDLMDEFVLNGHNVTVIGTNNSKKNLTEELKKENRISILRINSGKIRKTSHIRKAISLITLNGRILKSVKQHLNEVHFDLIIGPTPPITISLLYKKLKRYYKAPFYLLLKDIWPQGSVDLKVITKFGLPWLWLRAHEKRIYETADYIGCMSPKGVDYLLSKNIFLSRSKLEVCPNCIRPTVKMPDISSHEIRIKYNIPLDACVFLFSGNLGIGHGLGFLVEAIEVLKDYSKAYFVIGGSGTQYRFLMERFKELSLKNMLLYEWLPRDDFSQILATSNVGLILLHKYTVPQFPSRLLSYLDYLKPVLCAVNKHTDIGNIVEGSGSGISVDHGNLNEFVDAVKYLSENEVARNKMGENGHRFFLNNYTVAHGYKIIMDHFNVV